MAESIDCLVVGAGVVGLACARSLAMAGREVVVLEAETRIGMHASSRNSEVIHAGIYYPEDSLKARLCVAGKQALYSFCDARAVACKRTGKIIVATSCDDLEKLRSLERQAAKNGVADLIWLDADELRSLEPAVRGVAGLLSPSTGIIDSHALMLALQADIEARRGTVVLDSRVSRLRTADDGFEFSVDGERITCRSVVNSAGLWAQDVAAHDGLAAERTGPGRSGRNAADQDRGTRNSGPYAKGHYFAYQGTSPFRHLVYPLPSAGGLGIHATNDLAGAARFGPDVSWVKSNNYEFEPGRKAVFVTAIRRYFPGLDEARLVPAYTGIRSKLHGPGEPVADFVIAGPEIHGVRGLVNLFGIESPGLTSSLAIGGYVSRLL